MQFFDVLRTANHNLFRNKVRTFLTILAIFVGSFTIILNVAINAGVNAFIDEQTDVLGGDDFIMLLSKSNVYIEYNIRIIAFFTALLWGIHPVNVESVAWLSASKVLIYTFFYLLSLLCYLKYVQNRRNTYFLLTLFFFICSFLGKEHAVTLPVCLLLIDYFVGRDFHNRELWVEKISFFSLSLSLIGKFY